MPVVETILSMPASPGFRKIKFGFNDVVGGTASPFTGSQQVMKWPGEWWEGQASLPPMTRADAENWIAFLGLCHGRFRKFLFTDPSGRTPRGTGAGAPVIDGDNQGGSVISLKGFTANAVGVFLRGDYFEINNHLHKFLSDEDADANGKASFDIFPALRESPADGTPIITTNPKGTFRLSSNKRDWDVDEAKLFGIDFGFVEAF